MQQCKNVLTILILPLLLQGPMLETPTRKTSVQMATGRHANEGHNNCIAIHLYIHFSAEQFSQNFYPF